MKTTDYQDVVAALRALADALDAIPAPVKGAPPEAETSLVKGASPEAETSLVKGASPKEEKPLKLEDVRAVLSDISRQGKTRQMKELLTKFGATKLSEVEPSQYASLVREAEVIRDA